MVKVGDIVLYRPADRPDGFDLQPGETWLPAMVLRRNPSDGSLLLRVFLDFDDPVEFMEAASCTRLIKDVTLGKDVGQWRHRD